MSHQSPFEFSDVPIPYDQRLQDSFRDVADWVSNRSNEMVLDDGEPSCSTMRFRVPLAWAMLAFWQKVNGPWIEGNGPAQPRRLWFEWKRERMPRNIMFRTICYKLTEAFHERLHFLCIGQDWLLLSKEQQAYARVHELRLLDEWALPTPKRKTIAPAYLAQMKALLKKLNQLQHLTDQNDPKAFVGLEVPVPDFIIVLANWIARREEYRNAGKPGPYEGVPAFPLSPAVKKRAKTVLMRQLTAWYERGLAELLEQIDDNGSSQQ